MAYFWILVIAASTVWIGFDAPKRDWSGNRFADSPVKWVIGSLGLWLVVFPVYLLQRARVPLKRAPATMPPLPPHVATAPERPGSVAPPPSRKRPGA